MIYQFSTDYSLTPRARQPESPAQFPSGGQQQSHIASGLSSPPGSSGIGTSSGGGRVDVVHDRHNADPEDMEDFLVPGFRSLDESMKMYWSGIRVPTKDSYRFLRIKVAGGDKSLLIWRDDLANGRARLPVGSLIRTKEEFNKDKYSPPYHAMSIRYPNRRGNLAALVFRPTPWLVDYTLSVWAEHKRDAEYVLFQVLNRFNPLAEFVMFDGHLRGVVTIRFGGRSDQSDKETTTDQQRMIKYDYAMTAEAWLPLPERVIPTVLGMVTTVRDRLSRAVLSSLGSVSPFR